MDANRIDALLAPTLADGSLGDAEEKALRAAFAGADDAARALARKRAFALAQTAAGRGLPATAVIGWLEEVTRAVAARPAPPAAAGAGAGAFPNRPTALFTPGEGAVDALQRLLAAAERAVNVCVFTVADDRLTAAIRAAHGRGVRVRLLTDDAKRFDQGADVAELAAAGVPVRIDRTEFHMHHKFATFDGRLLATGSYNWTRGATRNYENLLLLPDAALVGVYDRVFEELWERFEAL